MRFDRRLTNQRSILIAVTGASGYVGQRLVHKAHQQGLEVVSLGRRPLSTFGVTNVPFDFRNAHDPTISQDAKALIHLAARTDGMNPEDAAAEVEAAKRLIAACPVNCRLVFLSSQSADPQSPSRYGLTKWRIEQLVTANGGATIRTGLVYGGPEMGLFGKLCRALRRLPAYPFFIFPRPIAQPVHVDDLADAILKVAFAPDLGGRLLQIAPAQSIPFDRMLSAIIRTRLNSWRLPVPVPISLLASLVCFVESRFDLKLGGGQLKSLANTTALTSQSDIAELGLTFRPLEEGLMARPNSRRRGLAREGHWLIAYFLKGTAPNGAVRRYVRALESQDEGPLLVSMPLPPRLALALLDRPGKGMEESAMIRRRMLLALMMAEATPQGARRMLIGPNGQSSGAFAAIMSITGNLFFEGVARILSALLGQTVLRRMLSQKGAT